MFCVFPLLLIKGQGKLLVSNISGDYVCSNFIYISGNTNINHFNFDMEFPGQQAFIVDKQADQRNKKNDDYKISIPVKKFNTSNKLIYNDFLTLLKANQYPKIIIGISYDQLQDFINGKSVANPRINITIAGVTNTYSIPCYITSCTRSNVYITGSKNIKLTDFNLDPPEKFQGLIKVKDEVLINFGFVFLLQSNS